jgi:SET domain
MSYKNMLIPGMSDLGEGQGLWLHYANHSCILNVRRSFAGNMLVFRAIHDIAAGEKTTISYTHTLEDVRDRREMLQTGLGLHCESSLCLLEAKTATDMLEERQRLIEEWRLVHREWDSEIGGGKPVNTEGGEDSPDWVQAPVALRDLEKLVMRLEKTYDKKEYENQPRLAAGYWGVELIVRMPQGVWPHGELRFALGTLRNFGYFINIQGDEVTMVRSRLYQTC